MSKKDGPDEQSSNWLRTCRLCACRLAALAGRVGARKPQRKKPKLTVDDLRKPMGMVYIVTEFAEEFRRVYKGPGHEVRRLAGSSSAAHVS